MWCTSFSQTKLSQPNSGAATVTSLSIFRKQRLDRVTVTYLVDNILLCTKPRTAGITIICVEDEMTVPNPGRQSCGGIVIYIWCGKNATLSLIKFL
jgi:hypothetical protein